VTVPAYAAQGKWTLVQARLVDNAGNAAYIGTSDLSARGYPASFADLAAPVIASPPDGSYTNAHVVTLSGTAITNSTVAVYDGSSSQGTATADGSGNWSKTLSSVAEGAHSYTAAATDAAGNTSPASGVTHVTVDTVAPVAPAISSPADGSYNNTGNVTLSGTAEANSTITVFDGPSSKGTTITNGSGMWTKTLSSVADGDHSYAATAMDAANNTSPVSGFTHLTVDTVGPAAPAISSPADGSYNNTGTVVLSGTAEANSAVTVLDGGTSKGTTSTDGSGAWTKTLSPIADGSHSYTATATDAANNTSPASGTTHVTVDTVAPATSITGGPSGATNQASPSFGFSSNETGSTFQCKLAGPGQASTYSACFSPAQYSGLADGAYTLTVRATDQAGNTDPSPPSRSFTVDTVTPAVPTISSPADGSYNNAGNVTLSGTAEANSTVTIFDGAASQGSTTASGAGSWTKTLNGLPDGTHSYTARATDAAGNVGPTSSAVRFTEYTAPPNTTSPTSPATPTTTPPSPSPTPSSSSATPLPDSSPSRAPASAPGEIRKRALAKCAHLKGRKRAKCVKKAKLDYKRAVAVIKCRSVKKSKRAACIRKAKKLKR
jgi:hypothetical protein